MKSSNKCSITFDKFEIYLYKMQTFDNFVQNSQK